jgi:alanine racemase
VLLVTARLTVDLAALLDNYRQLAAGVDAGLGAVVKADAYGLGAGPVCAALHHAGCRDFFVATAAEALALRVDARVYVFAGVGSEADAVRLRSAGVRPVLNDARQVAIWRRVGNGPCALHVDTGMRRLGFTTEAFAQADLSGLDVELLLTHYACADQPEHPLNAEQLRCFEACRIRLPGVATSLGNSAAILTGTAWVGDLGRPGIALYGGNPFAERPNPMRPVATLEGQVLQVRDVAPGQSVGYGATFVAARACRIATVGAGYADGVPRQLSGVGRVAVGETCCPIAGRVSMDAVQVDVTGVDVAEGDWLEFFGARVPVDEVADHAGTIAYEVLTGIGSRVHKRYLAP